MVTRGIKCAYEELRCVQKLLSVQTPLVLHEHDTLQLLPTTTRRQRKTGVTRAQVAKPEGARSTHQFLLGLRVVVGVPGGAHLEQCQHVATGHAEALPAVQNAAMVVRQNSQ
jgi:hypothetical protein